MDLKLAIALFRIAVSLIEAVQKARWYNQGRDAYAAQQKAEQDARVKRALEAIAGPDPYGPDSGVRDPNELP